MAHGPLVVADENLSALADTFGRHRTVVTKAGRAITREDLLKADTLLVRSVTQVTPALLAGTPVRFVGSATIGTDHLQVQALTEAGVTVVHAPGCNAQAVAEYVVMALLRLRPDWATLGQQPPRLGIVGLGNVGRRLARLAKRLDWHVFGHDPWVQWPEVPQRPLVDLLANCDAVSLHVPLTHTGPHPTHHLLDAAALQHWGARTMLINTSRGPVIDEPALMAAQAAQRGGGQQRPVVLDVFEHEPLIDAALLQAVHWVTPHVAGYSQEGKLRGTAMVYAAWCARQGIAPLATPMLPQASPAHDGRLLGAWLVAHADILHDIRRDDAALRACVTGGCVQGACFDALRKNYPLRREWSAHGV